jgi:hypothetical protein
MGHGGDERNYQRGDDFYIPRAYAVLLLNSYMIMEVAFLLKMIEQ